MTSQRFRRVGYYNQDSLLKDLQELDDLVTSIQDRMDSGEFKGEKGDTGARGDSGDRGLPGADGLPGPRGNQGTDGVAGLSAYQLAVLVEGFEGSEEEWLDSLAASSGTLYTDDFGFIDYDYGSVNSLTDSTEDWGGII